MAYTFGASARTWSERLAPQICAVIADASEPAHALAKAADLRLDGVPYHTIVLLDDARASVAMALGSMILAQAASLEDRRRLFDQLAAEALPISGGVSQRSLHTIDAAVLTTLKHLYNLADSLVVRSTVEYQRLANVFGTYRHGVHVHAPADPAVPQPSQGANRDSIIIWGPDYQSSSLALIAFALEELHTSVIAVSSDGAALPTRTRFVTPAHAGDVLARGLVIVDASLSDPGAAIALCNYGVPVVAASTSGAHEYLMPSYSYEPWNWRSALAAVSSALGAEHSPTQVRVRQQLSPPPERRKDWADPPLVSIVIPTFNRRHLLPHTLRRWAEQDYKNIELILVNDGGEPIDDIASAFPFVSIISLERNEGIPRAFNAGVRQAKGEYLILRSDDDEFSPDHVSTLIEALERTGAAVAHSNVLIRHEELGADGSHRVYGYSLDWNKPMDYSMVLATGIVAITGLAIRRDVYFECGGWDEELPILRDYNLVLNLAKRYDFVHVDRTTATYSSRTDSSSTGFATQSKIANALRTIYERNPVNGRPSIDMARQAELAAYENAAARPLFEPAMRLYPKT